MAKMRKSVEKREEENVSKYLEELASNSKIIADIEVASKLSSMEAEMKKKMRDLLKAIDPSGSP